MAYVDSQVDTHVVAMADEYAIQARQLDAERRENERLRAAIRRDVDDEVRRMGEDYVDGLLGKGQAMTAIPQNFRAGDVVRRKEKPQIRYVLACDARSGYAPIAGWPDGDIRVEEWEVIEAADDDVRIDMLRSVSNSRDDHGGLSRRAMIAREQLASEDPKP